MKIIIFNYAFNRKNIFIHTAKYNKKKNISYPKINKNDAVIDISDMNNDIIKLNFPNNVFYNIGILSYNNNFIYKTNTNYLIFKIKDNEVKLISSNEFEFNIKDYKSRRHKSAVKFWNIYWNCLHYFSYNYPNYPSNLDKHQIEILFKIMSTTGIKCPRCRNHFSSWISKYDIRNYYNSRNDLIRYFINLHNNVNKNNNKKTLSLNEVNHIYLNFDSNYLKKYHLDIDFLIKKKQIFKFVDTINSITRQKLLYEYDVIKYSN